MTTKTLICANARSGYHAIANWYCSQLPGKARFLNNCNEIMKPRNISVYKNPGSGRAMVCSFENFDLTGFRPLNIARMFQRVIIVLRDPYNWLASSLAKDGHLNLPEETFKPNKKYSYSPYFCQSMTRIDLWKQYARHYLGEENLIGSIPTTYILFNNWHKSEDYRKDICEQLDVEYNSAGLDFVSPRGSGSSFDKRQYRGRGSEMNVLKRYKEFLENPRYKGKRDRYFDLLDKEMREYSEKIFNFKPF